MFYLCVIILLDFLHKQPKIVSESKIIEFEHKTNECYLKFIPNIDLTSIFRYNTKQVFLYCISKNGKRHEMCWSETVKINDTKIFYHAVINNYSFNISEGSNEFTEYKFELRGNIFPWIGRIVDVKLGTFSYKKKSILNKLPWM